MISGAITRLCSALPAYRRMSGSSVVTASAREVGRRFIVVVMGEPYAGCRRLRMQLA